MSRIEAKHILALLLVFSLSAGLLSACASLPQPVEVEGSMTVTPTATLDPSGYQAVEPRACQTGSWQTLQSEQRQGNITTWLQGNLTAWQPGSTNLAYLAPGERSSWFTGVLMLAIGPDFKEHRQLAPTILVNGDLTWSPSGDRLAFLAYRPNESLYTVMVVNEDGSGLLDLFPADIARTDQRASQKAIAGWKNNRTLQVIASCGDVCRLGFDIDVTAPPGPVFTPTPLGHYRVLNDNLQIDRREQTVTPDDFPKIISTPRVSRPHWSPDDRMISYLDRRGVLWVLLIDERINFPVEIGLRDVYETQWSSAGDHLAIRAEDRIFVIQVPCQDN